MDWNANNARVKEVINAMINIIIAFTNQMVLDYTFSYLTLPLDFWILQDNDCIIHPYILPHTWQALNKCFWRNYSIHPGYMKLTRITAIRITHTEDILRKQLTRWYDRYKKYDMLHVLSDYFKSGCLSTENTRKVEEYTSLSKTKIYVDFRRTELLVRWDKYIGRKAKK